MSEFWRIAVRKLATNWVMLIAIGLLAFQITGEDRSWVFIVVCAFTAGVAATFFGMLDHWPKLKK